LTSGGERGDVRASDNRQVTQIPLKERGYRSESPGNEAMSGQAKIATSPKSRLKREIIVLNHLDICNKSYALYTFGPSLQQRIAIALSPWEIWLPCTAFLQN
jgi:hypothetical protein